MIDLSGGVPGIDTPDPTSFEEFWPFYLSRHLHPATRQVHLAGDSITLIGVVFGIVSGHLRRGVKLAILGFGLGVASHFIFEKNSPLDSDKKASNPLWLAQSDLRLLWLAYTGGLDADVQAVRASLGLGPAELTLASSGQGHYRGSPATSV
ncbi:MAG: Mpo1-like protein [Acidimicrobiales bacterium]